MDSQIVVGLETHVMLNSSNKLFCDCAPDMQHCDICQGRPGYLPRFNSKILDLAYPLCDVLNAQLCSRLQFYRKHYYYHDLPTGFQRSQNPDEPLARNGSFHLIKSNFDVAIKSIYLEQDPASQEKNLVNYDRCGSPLLEIVTDPVFKGSVNQTYDRIKQYLLTLSKVCVDLGIVDRSKICKTDVNVSLKSKPNLRYEIKNVTSIHAIRLVLIQAIKLLHEDSSYDHKTYHFRSNLSFSRLKEPYVFLREQNLQPYVLEPKTGHKLIFYDLFRVLSQKHRPSPSTYLYAKQLFDHVLKKFLDVKDLDRYVNYDPVVGLRNLKSLSSPSTELINTIQNLLFEHKISKLDFESKNRTYLDYVRNLKRVLNQNGVKFTSNLINKVLATYFQS